MFRLALCLLFLLPELCCQSDCKKGPVSLQGSDFCNLPTNFTMNEKESVVLIMSSSQSFYMNILPREGYSPFNYPTLLRLKIEQNTTLATCIYRNATELQDSRISKNFIKTKEVLNIIFSITFRPNTEKVWISKWNIDADEQQLGNGCGLEVEPNGKYLQLYFYAGTTYSMYAAMKCTKK